MSRFALTAGAIFCGLSVTFGAFGTHAIADWVTAARLDTWQTSSRFLMNHGLALLILGGLSLLLKHSFKRPICLLFSGASVFCASLFLLVILNMPWLGAIAPIGGLLMIIGWIDTAITLFRTPLYER